MRTTSATFLSALVVVGVLLAAPAAGARVIDRDFGHDERDIEPREGRDPDIKSTMRKLAVNDRRRVLTIAVRFYERHPRFDLHIRLDARGGPRVDHIMSWRSECAVWRKGHRRDFVKGRYHEVRGRFICRVPARAVHPSKPIRWKLRTVPPDFAPDFEIDYAPSDRGWYP